MKTRLLAGLALLALPALALAQKPLLNSSHLGAVNDLVFDAARDLLFSAGEDGTVRVWEPSGRIRACLKVSSRPVQRLALHPQLSQLAALVGEPPKTDTLAAWDWEAGRELFSLSSPQQLLHLAYAPQGGYLAYSRADFRSLAALEPQSGRPLPGLNRGFGIVSFFVISKNENTIMGYQPSGWLTYWDRGRDERLHQVRTLPDLSLIRITAGNRHILAAAGERLVAVDLLSGAVSAEDGVPGLQRLAVSPTGGEVSAEVRSAGAAGLRQWYFDGSALLPRRTVPLPVEPVLTSLAVGSRGAYTGDREGTLRLLGGEGAGQTLARHIYLPLTDLAFSADTAAACTPQSIYLFRTDFLSRPPAEATSVEVSRLPSPFPGKEAGALFLADRKLLVWKLGEEPGELALVDTAGGQSSTLPLVFDSPLRQLRLSGRSLVAVERSGVCRVLETEAFQERFRYNAGTVNVLTFTRPELLVGGASAASSFGSALFQINTRTYETVPLRDPSLFVYDLLYNRGVLFSLAVERGEQAEGRVRTVLARHSGAGLETRRVLAAYDGEDIAASLAAGPGGSLYCSLGPEAVLAWDGERLGRLENPGHSARRLYVPGDRLLARNTDASLSVWELASPGRPWEVHLLEDGAWVLISPDGSVTCSEAARAYLVQS